MLTLTRGLSSQAAGFHIGCSQVGSKLNISMQSIPEEWRESRDDRRGGNGGKLVRGRGDSEMKNGGEEREKDSMMMELTRQVQKMVKESSWWERRGVDCSILVAAFLCLPPGKKCLHTAVKVTS